MTAAATTAVTACREVASKMWHGIRGHRITVALCVGNGRQCQDVCSCGQRWGIYG